MSTEMKHYNMLCNFSVSVGEWDNRSVWHREWRPSTCEHLARHFTGCHSAVVLAPLLLLQSSFLQDNLPTSRVSRCAVL